jgi:hypothetical protein
MNDWQPIETCTLEEKVMLWHEGSRMQERGPVKGHLMCTCVSLVVFRYLDVLSTIKASLLAGSLSQILQTQDGRP